MHTQLNVKLLIPYDIFKEQAYSYIERGNALLSKKSGSIIDYNNQELLVKAWKKECVEWLRLCFETKNEFTYSMENSGSNNFVIPEMEEQLHTKWNNIRSIIIECNETIEALISWFPAFDLVVAPDLVNNHERSNFKASEKKLFVLHRLKIASGKYVMLADILKYNGIPYADNDPRELRDALAKSGLVERHPTQVAAKINLNGIEFIESIDESVNNSSTNINNQTLQNADEIQITQERLKAILK